MEYAQTGSMPPKQTVMEDQVNQLAMTHKSLDDRIYQLDNIFSRLESVAIKINGAHYVPYSEVPNSGLAVKPSDEETASGIVGNIKSICKDLTGIDARLSFRFSQIKVVLDFIERHI